MTAKSKCSAKTPDMYGVPNILSCSRSATVERDGRRYCWQHDPERVEADAEKRLAAWQAEQDRLRTVCARGTRNTRLAELVTPEVASLLERLALRVLEYGVGKEDARQGRELAARIREALEVSGD